MDAWARCKWRGFSPGAVSRQSPSIRVNTDFLRRHFCCQEIQIETIAEQDESKKFGFFFGGKSVWTLADGDWRTAAPGPKPLCLPRAPLLS